jgi:FAD/FMN-containing dehydrogenase
MASALPFDDRDSWENHLGNQSVDPLRIYEPESIEQVAAIVAEAARAGVEGRALGSS